MCKKSMFFLRITHIFPSLGSQSLGKVKFEVDRELKEKISQEISELNAKIEAENNSELTNATSTNKTRGYLK